MCLENIFGSWNRPIIILDQQHCMQNIKFGFANTFFQQQILMYSAKSPRYFYRRTNNIYLNTELCLEIIFGS